MTNLLKITTEDAIALLNKEEEHFFDVTSKDCKGKTIQKKCSAFANSDGGELLVGIIDRNEKGLPGGKFERWNGFSVQEDANDTISNIVKYIDPAIVKLYFEFLEIIGQEKLGKVLKVVIDKSPNVHSCDDGRVYVRRGAQCIPIVGTAITSLELSKGQTSYENQLIADGDVDSIENSEELNSFLSDYSPRTEPRDFLRKQYLVKKQRDNYYPICAGILLYEENPSAILPKKCGLKIVRYATSDDIPEREHLKSQSTVEGPVYQQIKESVRKIQKIINSIPIMGPSGLERAIYPREAIKEILVNAIIHRDYNISDDVQVLIFDNRIEIHSPGSLPGHITLENILDERYSRNSKIVRLLNKYHDRPNQDIGEGLNTAFQKMSEVRLKKPIIKNENNKVIVILPHERLASPEDQILKYLETHKDITNEIARAITGIKSENNVKSCFYRLRDRGVLELDPSKSGSKSAWRKPIESEKNKGSGDTKNDFKKVDLFQTTLFD